MVLAEKRRVVGVIMIEATQEEVWTVITDWDAYGEYVPGVKYYKTIKKQFTMLDNKPQKMDFTLLFNIIDLNVYNTSFQSFQSKTVPDIRSSLSQEQDWEEHFWVFEDLALDIVINDPAPNPASNF
jgi:hypothetical protein